MYKNFNLTDEERKEIMEQHGSFGYKKPINEQLTDNQRLASAKGYGPVSKDYANQLGKEGKLLSTAPNNQPAQNSSAAPAGYTAPAEQPKEDPSLVNCAASLSEIKAGSNKILKHGCKTEAVKELQKMLGMEAKYHTGMFGKITKAKVIEFQKDPNNKDAEGKALVPDGRVGDKTYDSLVKAKTSAATTTDPAKDAITTDTTTNAAADSTAVKVNEYIAEETTNSSLIGKSATFYASEREAQDAYKAGKSNPSAKGAIIGTITGMDKIENDYVSFKVKMTKGVHDDRGAVGKLLGGGTVFTYMRENGFFTVEGMTGTNYYSESVKQILNKEFFTSDLASNNKMQPTSNMAEEIDTDDEEMELSKSYSGDDDDMEDETPDFDMEFGDDPDEFEDLYDLSVAKQGLPKDKMVDMSRSGPKDIDYNVAQDFYNEIPTMINGPSDMSSRTSSTIPKQPTSDYYLRTYGTPDPDMESETLADRKKNAPLNFPKMTGKDKYSSENMLSWEQKKAAMAQRAEKEASRAAAREKRLAAASLKPGVNESKRSITLTESQLLNLIKSVVKKLK